SPSSVTQERTASPSMWTVQAPQAPTPQPNFVPARPRRSRRTQSRGMLGSASTACCTPFTRRSVIVFGSPERALFALRGLRRQRLEIGDHVPPLVGARQRHEHAGAVHLRVGI